MVGTVAVARHKGSLLISTVRSVRPANANASASVAGTYRRKARATASDQTGLSPPHVGTCRQELPRRLARWNRQALPWWVHAVQTPGGRPCGPEHDAAAMASVVGLQGTASGRARAAGSGPRFQVLVRLESLSAELGSRANHSAFRICTLFSIAHDVDRTRCRSPPLIQPRMAGLRCERRARAWTGALDVDSQTSACGFACA